MITTIQEHPGFAASVVGALMFILGYFIRKVDKKIDTHSDMITAIKGDLVVQLSNMRTDIKEDIVEAFNNICTERQGSCSRLQQAKLDTLTATHAAICAKFARLDEERKDAWLQQRRWNDKVETTIYSDKRKGER